MPVSAFFAVARASGTPAPEGSFTCPTIVLVIVWAQPKPLTITLNNASLDTVLPHNKTLQVMCLSPGRANPCLTALGGRRVTKDDITRGPSLSMALSGVEMFGNVAVSLFEEVDFLMTVRT